MNNEKNNLDNQYFLENISYFKTNVFIYKKV